MRESALRHQEKTGTQPIRPTEFLQFGGSGDTAYIVGNGDLVYIVSDNIIGCCSQRRTQKIRHRIHNT